MNLDFMFRINSTLTNSEGNTLEESISKIERNLMTVVNKKSEQDFNDIKELFKETLSIEE
jgi:methionyl-tRNA synthetase